MDMKRRQLGKFSAAIAGAAILPRAFAKPDAAPTYPSRPITLVIPFEAGGGTDIVGRVIGNKLSEALGQPVVIENRAGGNGSIGANKVAKSAPDGHTLTMVTGSLTVNVTLQGNKQPYDLLRDFVPVTQITSQPYVLVANPAMPAKPLAELIALARAKPGTLNFGSSGIGGLSHLSGELFALLAKIKMTHIPYKGGSPAMNAVIGGQIQMLFSTRIQAHPFITSGQLRALAVSTATRSPAAPELPTMQEGGVPGFEVAGWYGMLAPAGTPAAIVEKLNQAIVNILKMPEVRERMDFDGSVAVGSSSAAFGAHLRSEVEKWRRVIHEANIPIG